MSKKRTFLNHFLEIIHSVLNFLALLLQFVKVVIIVSVFIIGRLDFYINENLEFDYEDIALSFDSYKDSYLINRIVELNYSDQAEEIPPFENELTTIISVINSTDNGEFKEELPFDLNYTMPIIYIEEPPLSDKLRVNYSAYVIYFVFDLINNMIIFYFLERRHFKMLFLFQSFDILWILFCYLINFYCCLIESLLFKCFVIIIVILFVFIDFLS